MSKGTRAVQPVPASPQALRQLALYFHQRGTRLRRADLAYRARPDWATEVFGGAAVLQRANAVLGTDWSLHDLPRPRSSG